VSRLEAVFDVVPPPGTTWTSYPGPGGLQAYVDSAVVLPDGRLLIDVQAWSDLHRGHPSARPQGLYTGGNWSATAPVAMGAPFDVGTHSLMMNILDLAVASQAVTVYAQTPDQTGVVASNDGGATWQPVPAR
jgi:hypothetical protein